MNEFFRWQRALVVSLALTLIVVGCTENVDWAGPRDASPADVGVEVHGAGNTYRATIRRTAGDVAHVSAQNLTDLAFGQGWASGQDRTCDLADQVLKVTSRRSEFLGPGKGGSNLDSDFAWLASGIAKTAAADWKTSDPQIRDLFKAYTAGWNGHLVEAGIDNINDWCAGRSWVHELRPVDVYTYARSIALLGSTGAVIDLIGKVQPPDDAAGNGSTTTPESSSTSAPSSSSDDVGDSADSAPGSNGWAIGADRTENGHGMLLANPHFPWEGELRFWEVHLSIPGKLDKYGVQLSGLPGLAVGFNENFGWTHTVSAGYRMTAYKLKLMPGSPTTYVYGDGTREMTSQDAKVKVLGKDGKTTIETRRLWSSHYGPILDFPGFGWTDQATISFRDANLDNDEFIEQYMKLLTAQDLDDLIELNRRYTGVPLFNTIAVSKDGRAWYADTSATPDLSEEAQVAYQQSLKTDPVAAIARDNGAVLLDGSDPTFEWQDEDGARDPGLVPYSEMPKTERSDYVFNANDSFWMSNAEEMIEGNYSILHGPQRTARSPRTRENATLLSDTSPDGPAGADGKFSLKELQEASLSNVGYTARILRDAVVKRCATLSDAKIDVPDTGRSDKSPDHDLQAKGTTHQVDLSEACRVLSSWDDVYDIDSRGPVIWREFLNQFDYEDLVKAGPLWAEPFDASDPVGTPSGLAQATEGGDDQILVKLGLAVDHLSELGIDVDTSLGNVQRADRNGVEVPIHGGTAVDGTTNVVGQSTMWSTLDPRLLKLKGDAQQDSEPASPDADDRTETLYPVTFGTSFLMALEFTDEGPQARTILTYGNTADRSSPDYLEATEAFSRKQWKKALLTNAAIEAATTSRIQVRG